jgi:hypothetical protein
VTGCDFLWAACVGRAELCAVLCVACVRRCACGDVCALCSGCGCVSVRCAVRRLLVCAVLGDTRHDAVVLLSWVGLVTSCVSARVFVWCDGSGERGAGQHMREVALGLRKCELQNRGCVIGATMRVSGVHCRRCLERSE